MILINNSPEDNLDRIPEELITIFLPLLKEHWRNLRGLILPNDCSLDQSLLHSTNSNLATAIFRLSMNQTHHANLGPVEIRKTLFGCNESEFESFILNYWEYLPGMLRGSSKNSEHNTTVFSSLLHSFNFNSVDSILDSVLRGLVSCPPIASDELDILSFLNEVNSVLGSPIMYGQDIRVLKTETTPSDSIGRHANKEVHYFKDNTGVKFLDVDCVKRCKEAFQNGYTVALRGIEFRNDKVAAIAEGLAELFGQPSAGANMYLTPPSSQGLARHYDDHCVFVYQLFGHKQWGVSPHTMTLLPRLYEPLLNLPCSESDECMHILLQPGDILYIPRGCLHEAHTVINKIDSMEEISTMFSLHLTLGIEVEPPFEWEGFSHIALCCWNQNLKHASQCIDYKFRKQRYMLVNLLHIAIRLIAEGNPIFRKACMVAAFPLLCDAHDHLLNQEAIFTCIIDIIDASSNFMEVFRNVEAVVQDGNDDSLQWMRWFQHLSQEGDGVEKLDCNSRMAAFRDFIGIYNDNIEEATIEFTQIKSEFCRHVSFEDASKNFKMLLEKYRKTRKQYMKGMLSLQSTY